MAYDELEQRVADRTKEVTQVNEVLRSDITERKQTEEKLQQSERLYRLVADNSNDWIYLINLDQKLCLPLSLRQGVMKSDLHQFDLNLLSRRRLIQDGSH